MKVLQINLNHCEAAQDLLAQTVIDKEADVALISEPYRAQGGNVWAHDKTKKAAIWTCGRQAIQEIDDRGEGFVRAKVGGIHFYSCYAPPSLSLGEYETMLRSLALDAQGKSSLVIGGDFNAWAVEWGSRITNQRGRVLLETFAPLRLNVVNNGGVSTFRKAGRESIIDITFVSDDLFRHSEWKVSEEFTHSDHQAVLLTIERRRCDAPPPQTGPKWKDKLLDAEMLTVMLENYQVTPAPADQMARQLTQLIGTACDAAMPRRKVSKRGQPKYWWNDDIKALRKECLKHRRIVQRLKRRPGFEEALLEFRVARGRLSKAIKASKSSCFKRLCDEADINPWGTAYRMVMSKVKGKRSPALTCPVMMRAIVEELFPNSPEVATDIAWQNEEVYVPPLLTDELLKACAKIGNNKAPGPDGIPNRALKAAVKKRPVLFAGTMQKCLDEGVFPEQWKVQQLVLLPKGNKPPGEPSSYRPICLLDTMGKILERVIYNRLLAVVEEKGILSSNQYGFRKHRSTVDAIKTVVDAAAAAIDGGRWRGGTMEYCAVITLDVRNAFNTARWSFIKSALARAGVPRYLRRIISSYLSKRRLKYWTCEGWKYYWVTEGVPQGSVLGPLLWIIMYNGVLQLRLPKGVKIVGFADDIAIVVVAKQIQEVETAANEAIRLVREWLQKASLSLADHKTEAVLITGRKTVEHMTVQVGDQSIASSESLKYLGMMIDNRLSYKKHIEYVSEKASRLQAALSGMLPNVGGPRHGRRLLLAKVVTSAILYAAPIWAPAMSVQSNRKKLAGTYRLSALRTIGGFRTISDDAAGVLAGMMPIDILVEEISRVYSKRNQLPRAEWKAMKEEERDVSIARWQTRWDATTKGRWTHRLIPNLETWLNRKQGECGYQLTQFLTGHGGYRKYLHRFGHDNSPLCPNCPEEEEDTEHAIFYCRRFEEERTAQVPPGDVVEYMMQSEQNWREMCGIVTTIQTELRRIEKIRRSEGA